MSADPGETLLKEFRPVFKSALAVHNISLANLIALQATERLFEADPDNARTTAWKEFYLQLSKRYRAQYQCFDFEVVDYELYAMPESWSLLRGPKLQSKDVAKGKYVTFLGAAQLFGRYQRVSPPRLVANTLKMPCMNLSAGGSGPESFLRDDVLKIVNHGRAVVLQVLSGRSIGCEEYPGTRMTYRPGHEGEKKDRLKLLREIWLESRSEAVRLAAKWQGLYVRTMTDLIGRIEVPVVLAWISTRAAADWSLDRLDQAPDFGDFPQLVDGAMTEEISRNCSGFVNVSKDAHLPYGFRSRFTGKRCPVLRPNGGVLWQNSYYPSAQTGEEIGARVAAALGDAMR